MQDEWALLSQIISLSRQRRGRFARKIEAQLITCLLVSTLFAPTSAVHRVAVIQEEDDDTMMDQGVLVLSDGGTP